MNGVSLVDGHIDEITETDVVEVVRCKDCKYCETVEDAILHYTHRLCSHKMFKYPVEATNFCSYGERKEKQ